MMFVSGYRWQPVFCGFVTLEFRYVSMGSGGHFVPRSYILATFSSVMSRFMRQKITCRLILYENMTLFIPELRERRSAIHWLYICER